MSNNLIGGEKAKKASSVSHSVGMLVYILYLDHVLFLNANQSLLGSSLREAIGWIASEAETELTLCIDRAYKAPPFGNQTRDSGLVIVKSTIQKIIEIEEKWKS